MYILVQLILLLLCIQMFRVNRPTKFAILLLASICFNSVVMPFVFFGGSFYVLSFCFIASEFSHIRRNFRLLKGTIIKSIIFAMLISMFFIYFNSPHYNGDILQFVRLFLLEMVGKWLVLSYSFFCISSDQSLKPAIKVSFYGLLVLTAFGILNLAMKQSIFVSAISTGINDMGVVFMDSDRFRVQAMFTNPFDYGFICVVLILFYIYGYTKHLMRKKDLYIGITCCLFGIVFCGCRTIIFCFLASLIALALASYKLSKWMKYVSLGIVVAIVSYTFVPVVQEKIDSMTTMFDMNSEIGGSSMPMRILQYETVLRYIEGHELFGRGKDFFWIDLGWAKGPEGLVDKDLQGLEGVALGYLLEYGIVGTLFYYCAIIALYIYMWKKRKSNRLEAGLGVAILTTYVLFANMTGELSSPFPTFLFVGALIGIIERKQIDNDT